MMWTAIPRTASPVKGSSSRSRSASLSAIRCRNFGPQLVPIVDCRRDHRPRPVLDSPPAFVPCTIVAHAADSVWNIIRFLRGYLGSGHPNGALPLADATCPFIRETKEAAAPEVAELKADT